MNGEKDAAASNASFVALGYIFGDAQPDESTRQTADCSSHADAAKQRHDGTCRDKWSQPGDSQHSDTDKPSERSTNDRAGGGPGCRAFGRLGTLFKSEVFSALVEGEENRNVRVPKTFALQLIHR